MFIGSRWRRCDSGQDRIAATSPCTTSAIVVDMRPRQQEVTFDDLFTADGVPLDFHSAIQYRITDSVKLVRDFGADDGPNGMGFFARNLEQSYRMIVRDAVKKARAERDGDQRHRRAVCG
jgi:uncharacterized membrane protein YqiK